MLQELGKRTEIPRQREEPEQRLRDTKVHSVFRDREAPRMPGFRGEEMDDSGKLLRVSTHGFQHLMIHGPFRPY